MNLKTLSMASVQPIYVWKADALKPGMIIRPYLLRSICASKSKKRGERPIYFSFVSRKA